MVEELKRLTKEDVVNLYEEVFYGEDRGRILVRGTGTAHVDEAPSNRCFAFDCVLLKLVERIR